MVTVHLAEDVKHRRTVAVTVLHPELSAVLRSERFVKEIELTASLQHPHILPPFDSGAAALAELGTGAHSRPTPRNSYPDLIAKGVLVLQLKEARAFGACARAEISG